MKNRIIDSIINSDSFNEHYNALLLSNVCSQFENIELKQNKFDFDSKYLLKCADILSMSDKNEVLDKALRICQTTISSQNFSRLEQDKSEYILTKLGNYPLSI